jgi:hypothetical protein
VIDRWYERGGARTTGDFRLMDITRGLVFGDSAAGSMSMMTAFIRFSRLGYMGRLFFGYDGEWESAFDATVWLECLSASVLEDFRGFSEVVLHMILS